MKIFQSILFPFSLTLLVIVFLTQMSWKLPNNQPNTALISGDGVGYYQYLISLFILKDIDNQELNGAFMMPVNDKVVNKCFVGAAVCMSPFFGAGIIHHKLINEEFNPYSLIMQRWINIGGIVYLLLGLFLVERLLSSFKINKGVRYLSLVGLLFGTNLFLYSILSPSMTHVYSFFSVSGFLYAGRCFFIKSSIRSGYIAAFFIALIVLIRPVNGMVLLLLPFLSDGVTPLLKRVKELKFDQYLKAFLISFLVIFLQPLFWYLQSGQWFVWSYGEEGFNFYEPEIYQVLFGFRKGWFIYTPMALLAMPGLIFLYRRNKESFLFLTGFLLVLIYMTASWWNWFYGSSFGQRPFVDFYALVAFLLALFLQQIRTKVTQIGFGIVLILLIFLNLVQTYQYKENLISSWDMSYEKYKATFLVTEVGAVKIGGNRSILPYQSTLTTRLDTLVNFSSNIPIQTAIDSLTGNQVADFSGREYNLSWEVKLADKVGDRKGNYLELGLERLEKSLYSSENAKVIVLLKDSVGKEYYSYWFIMNEVPEQTYNQWKGYEYQVLLPPTRSPNDELIVFIRNEDKASFYVKNFRVKLSGID